MRAMLLASVLLLVASPAGAKSLAPAGTGVAHSAVVGGLHNHPGKPKTMRGQNGPTGGGGASPAVSGGFGAAGEAGPVEPPPPRDRDAALAAAMARVDNSAQIRSQGLGGWRRPYTSLDGTVSTSPEITRPDTADAPTSVTQY